MSSQQSFQTSEENVSPDITKIPIKEKIYSVKKDNNRSVIDKISLSSKSKIFLILRVLIFCLLCVYFPLETILYRKLQEMENRLVISKVSAVISSSTLNSGWFYYLSYFSNEILSGQESIIVYVGIIFMLFHPFIALKLVFITNVTHFFITVLQCLYQSHRPFWNNPNNEIIFCPTNYGFPSGTFFLTTFFFLYMVITIRLMEKEKKLSILKKFIIFILYFGIITYSAFIVVINSLNYIYQLIFSLTISLVVICFLIDIDTVIHNFILKSLKNVFKTRKYKMKIFFYVLAMSVTTTILYFFVPTDDLNKVEDYLLPKTTCDVSDVEQLGLKKTFTDLSYIFGIIGAFWGASNAVENECSVWWEATFLNLSLKVFCTLLLNCLYFYLSSLIKHSSFELNFLLSGFKYFAHYYIVMGLLPIAFEKVGLNKKRDVEIEQEGRKLSPEEKSKIQKKNSQLFSKTIFSQKFSKKDIKFLTGENQKQHMPLLEEDDSRIGMDDTMKDNEITNKNVEIESKEIKNEKEKEKEGIYKKSLLVGGFTKRKTNENLEFTMNRDLSKSEDDSNIEENYFNNDLSYEEK